MVKDKIFCEEFGEVRLKGISHPVMAYRVVDFYSNLQEEREVVHEEFPNFSLDINIQDLSPDDRGRAATALNLALEKLGGPEEVAVKNVG